MAFKTFGLLAPKRPKPFYSFFPIYSPFKVHDNDGFDLGEDNRIKSIDIKDGALQFEVSLLFYAIEKFCLMKHTVLIMFPLFLMKVEFCVATRPFLGKSLFGVYRPAANFYHYDGSGSGRDPGSSPKQTRCYCQGKERAKVQRMELF